MIRKINMAFVILAFVVGVVGCTTSIHHDAAGISSAETDSAVRRSISDWTEGTAGKNFERVKNLFDTTSDVMLVGSDSSELFKGPKQIEIFLQSFFSQPFTISWKINNIDISTNENTAWAFVDAKLTVTTNAGEQTSMPYRFAVIMVQRNNVWKWKLYHGSVPAKA